VPQSSRGRHFFRDIRRLFKQSNYGVSGQHAPCRRAGRPLLARAGSRWTVRASSGGRGTPPTIRDRGIACAANFFGELEIPLPSKRSLSLQPRCGASVSTATGNLSEPRKSVRTERAPLHTRCLHSCSEPVYWLPRSARRQPVARARHPTNPIPVLQNVLARYR
jgi:hypothetical protein